MLNQIIQLTHWYLSIIHILSALSTVAGFSIALKNSRTPCLMKTKGRHSIGARRMSHDNNPSPIATPSVIKNFRPAAGLKDFIYRCASTDKLANVLESSSDEQLDRPSSDMILSVPSSQLSETSPESIVLNKAGLILDLRSDSERDEILAKQWMSAAPGGKFSVRVFQREDDQSNNVRRTSNNQQSQRIDDRTVYRVDVLSPSRLFRYLSENWVNDSISQQALYNFYYVMDGEKLHEMRMDIMNQHGLEGLYEAIIETGKDELCASLMAITEYLEVKKANYMTNNGFYNDEDTNTIPSDDNTSVIVHCVQGKDRTGLLIMLCQSIIGLDENIIIQDYAESDKYKKQLAAEDRDGSAAGDLMVKKNEKGKLDRSIFSGAPAKVMKQTLKYIRSKYGSVLGYLDAIGFDNEWRLRFTSALDWNNTKSKL